MHFLDLAPIRSVAGTVKLSPTQVAAAKIILSKIVPDLNRTELGGLDGKPIDTSITVNFKAVPPEQSK